MRKNKNVIFIGLVSTGLLLAGCGSSDDSYYDDFNTVDPNPTDPEPSDPVLSETEKAEANRTATFFLNTVTAESLNHGLLDRVLSLQKEMLNVQQNSACYQATIIASNNYSLTKNCTVAYDVNQPFQGISGAFSQTSNASDPSNLTTTFNNLKLRVDEADFTFNGTLSVQVNSADEIYSTNDLVISTSTGEKFKFKDFSLKTTQSATSIQQEVIGTIETEGFDSAYKVSFKSITPWQRNPTVSAYPMMGKLRVEYSNDTSTYLTVTALNTSSATYYAQKGSYVIADNLSLTWPQIIVSPAQYQLE